MTDLESWTPFCFISFSTVFSSFQSFQGSLQCPRTKATECLVQALEVDLGRALWGWGHVGLPTVSWRFPTRLDNVNLIGLVDADRNGSFNHLWIDQNTSIPTLPRNHAELLAVLGSHVLAVHALLIFFPFNWLYEQPSVSELCQWMLCLLCKEACCLGAAYMKETASSSRSSQYNPITLSSPKRPNQSSRCQVEKSKFILQARRQLTLRPRFGVVRKAPRRNVKNWLF